MELYGNTISNLIYNDGLITSPVYVTVLNNKIVEVSEFEVPLNATVCDDNGNNIYDPNFRFVVNDVASVIEPIYNKTIGLYSINYPMTTGLYFVNATLGGNNTINKIGIVINGNINATYSDLLLKMILSKDHLVLPYDFAYNAEIDGDKFPNGVVINKDLVIDGNGHTISGSNAYRIFNITASNVELNNIVFVNGNSNFGGAIYVNKGTILNINNVTFNNNTATYRGGAIWSAGKVSVENSLFDSNNITYRKENLDYGGAAIANMGGTLNINNSRFTNNLPNYVPRSGDTHDPQLIDGVVLSSGNAVIKNSYFENNSGTYGGAITTTLLSHTHNASLIVENSEFINNLAYCGAAIYAGSDLSTFAMFSVNNCTFIGNNATGIGSIGYTSAGGAIALTKNSQGNITNSKFINNTATVGGAIDVSTTGNPENNIVKVDGCTFENNTAVGSIVRDKLGGAIRLGTKDMTITVMNSNFINNNADNGSAIYNNADLTLSNNTVTGGCGIYNNGTLDSQISSTVLGNKTITVYYGDEIKLNSTLTDDNGNNIYDVNFNFVVNGKPVAFDIYDENIGMYYANFNLAEPSSYIVNATAGTTRLVTKTGTIIVQRIPTNITVNTTSLNLNVSDSASADASLTPADAGNLVYTSNNTEVAIVDGNGVIKGLKEGNATITVSFDGNERYAPAESKTITVTVNKIPTEIEIASETITLNVSDSASAGASLTPADAGSLKYISSNPEVVTVDGNGVIKGLKEGSATITVSFDGNERYAPAESKTITVTVNPEVIVQAPDVTKYYNGPERFVVTVTDGSGVPIAGKSVIVNINGVGYSRTTDDKGVVSLPLKLNSGIYGVSVVVDDITVKSTVNILTTVNGTDVVKMFHNATQYYATFRDSNGKYLAAGTSVQFNINGVMYTRTIEGNEGLAKLNINLPQGSYIITAINPVTGEYGSNKIVVLPLLTASDMVKKQGTPDQFVATLYDNQGRPYAGQMVSFNINGVMYYKTTDSEGHAKLNINLPAGEYIITSSYNGCNIANKITVTP
jgi:predicted outer membrane repeat protein